MWVLGISSQPESILQDFIEDQGITFPVLRDVSAADELVNIYYTYNIPGGQSPYPRDFIVDQDGIIRFADTEYDPGTMITVIEGLLSGVTTAVFSEETITPGVISILSVYPNPFNSSATIEVENPQGQGVELEIFEISGRWIDTIYSGWLSGGSHQFRWKGSGHQTLTSGIYLITLRGENFTTSRKVILLK